MTRKTKEIHITQSNRDEGKVFKITEMPALQSEKWASRALLVLSRRGFNIPANPSELGMEALARIAIEHFAQVPWHDIEPLLDEMWNACVQIVEQHATRRPTEDDIEEITTIWLLRKEAVALHMDFFGIGGLPKSPPVPA